MTVINAVDATKRVEDPNAEYDSLRRVWRRNRAICGGEQTAKNHDVVLDAIFWTNLLIPFSTSMSPAQYAIYRSEAELPGIVAEFIKMMVGGLLRKGPSLSIPKVNNEDTLNWILNEFAEDGTPLASFLDDALDEEFQTSRAWVYLDLPVVTDEDAEVDIKPYPILYRAESIINWRTGKAADGSRILTMIVIKGFVEDFSKSEFHPEYIETVWVHDLDQNGEYRIRTYQESSTSQEKLVEGGKTKPPRETKARNFELKSINENYLVNGERLDYIPAWPLNGFINPINPAISVLVDKEIALYNKLSRRNHLLYGASTYTPVVHSDMGEVEFDKIVNRGLGSWLLVGKDDKVDTLKTPTESLADMENTIRSSIEEIAKLGIRMLTPENNQSGVALEIRSAVQNAKIGALNLRVSNTMRQIIATMINWKDKSDLKPSDVHFTLSGDFNPTPLGADWLRLATEWYENRKIPRSVWLDIAKENDLIKGDYDDKEGMQEILRDRLTAPNVSEADFADEL